MFCTYDKICLSFSQSSLAFFVEKQAVHNAFPKSGNNTEYTTINLNAYVRMKIKKVVIVTGATGFIGKYTIQLLLSKCFHNYHHFTKGFLDDAEISIKDDSIIYQEYDEIIAIDMHFEEKIHEIFCYHPAVVPLKMNLLELNNTTSSTYHKLSDILFHNTKDKCEKDIQIEYTIIHIAGVVDTRETERVQKLLLDINKNATKSLVNLAYLSGNVRRYIQLSSSSAITTKDVSYKVPLSLKRLTNWKLLNQSMLTSDKMIRSTYGDTKRSGELVVLEYANKENITNKAKMVVCILRPHVVWGRGDTLSTEMLLNWPKWMPYILIGSAIDDVLPIRADNVARYLLLADTALTQCPTEVDGKCFNIGDENMSFLQLLTRIVHCRIDNPCINVSNSQEQRPLISVDTSIFGLKHRIGSDNSRLSQNEVIFMQNTEKKNTYLLTVYCLPNWIVFCLVLIAEWLDYFSSGCLNWTFLRLVTANNVVYCSGSCNFPITASCHENAGVKCGSGILVQPMLCNYNRDCEELYKYACYKKGLDTLSTNEDKLLDTNKINVQFIEYMHSINTPKIDMLYMNKSYLIDSLCKLVQAYTNVKQVKEH